MTSGQLIAVLIVIVILVILYTHIFPRKSACKYQKILKLDDAKERQQFIKKAEEEPENLDADDLFTKATIYLRMQDDIEDRLQSVGRNDVARDNLARQLMTITQKARSSIRAAVAKRNIENQQKQPPGEVLFHDDAIDRRAMEIEDQIARITLGVAPPEAPPRIAVPAIRHSPKWAPDPENVHDSAVGDGIMRRIQYLKRNDYQLIDKSMCVGTTIILMNERLNKNDSVKREKITRTLERAMRDEHCGRYNIDELEALRLVLEHAHHAENEEKKNNLHDALLESLSECAAPYTGTVCLTGRISRYIASLDGVDEAIGEEIKPVDAYRAEIFNSVGQVSKTGASDDVMRGEINKICDQYKERLPEQSLEKIRHECMAGLG